MSVKLSPAQMLVLYEVSVGQVVGALSGRSAAKLLERGLIRKAVWSERTVPGQQYVLTPSGREWLGL